MRISILTLLLLMLTACSYMHPYRLDVQQGNVISQDMLNELTPGMTKNQVADILGAPALHTPFKENRWQYVYSFQPGGKKLNIKRLTVEFEQDKLVKIVNDKYPV